MTLNRTRKENMPVDDLTCLKQDEHEHGDRPNDVQIHEEVEFEELADNDDRSDRESTGDWLESDDNEVRVVADDGEVLDGGI